MHGPHHQSRFGGDHWVEVAARSLSFRPGDLRQSEIQYFGLAPWRQHDVGGLDVAVGNAFRMGLIQRVGHLQSNLHDLSVLKRTAADL